MFTQITVSVRPVFDVLQWHVHAVWQDDERSEPVSLFKDGETRANPWADVPELLQAAVDALAAEVNSGT